MPIKLEKKFERQNTQVVVSCRVNSKHELDTLSYADFKAESFEGGKLQADITDALVALDLFTTVVDTINWHELFQEQIAFDHH